MDLGVFGVVINWNAFAWMLLMSVILLFPQYLPLTASYMNYTVAVITGVVLFYALSWVSMRERDPVPRA